MTADDDIAALRIELEDFEPLIWRRVGMRSSMNLKALHNVIQAAMGGRIVTCGSSLRTSASTACSFLTTLIGIADKNAARTKLSALLTTGIPEIGYVYDIRDNWRYRVIVEKPESCRTGALYPQFLGGGRRCPPEDCGGFPGYYEFLSNIASKERRQRQAALNWYRGPYDPDEIDEQKILIALKQISSNGRRTR